MIAFLYAVLIFLGSVLVAVATRLIVDEIKAWLPRLPEYFLRTGLAALPDAVRSEKEREWIFRLATIPGVGTKAVVAAHLSLYPVVRDRFTKTFMTGFSRFSAAAGARVSGRKVLGINSRRHIQQAMRIALYGSVAFLWLPALVGPEDFASLGRELPGGTASMKVDPAEKTKESEPVETVTLRQNGQDGRTRTPHSVVNENLRPTDPLGMVLSIGDKGHVQLRSALLGTTSFIGRNHYAIVTPPNGSDWVTPMSVGPDGKIRGDPQFGENNIGIGDSYLVRVLVTASWLSPGELSVVPADAIITAPIVVTREL